MKRNARFIPLWIMFLVFGFCCAAIKMDLWILLSAWTIGLSVFLLIRMKLPSKKSIIISAVMAVLVMIAYLGIHWVISMTFDGPVRSDIPTLVFSELTRGIPTFLCSLAVFSVMEKQGGIKLISTDKKLSPLISVIIAIDVAAVLSSINFFLMKNDNPADFEISVSRLIVCLIPAIYEEIVCRAIFMAFSLYVIGEEKPTKFQTFTMWFMMCFPHTAAHGYDIVSTVILCVLFGLPFTLLQRKRNLASAMISHGLVDAVRFTVFGLGL